MLDEIPPASEGGYSLSEVRFGYRPGNPVLENLDARFVEGRFFAVIGPNGAGKSTLLRLLSGRLHPQSGSALFQGKPIQTWSRRSMARKVAVVPQGEPITFEFTVREVVLMGRFAYGTGPLGLEDLRDYEVVDRCLAATDLRELADRPMGALSGGERQRVLVARALAQEPEVLLLDEPTTAMDPLHRKRLMDLLDRLNRVEGKTIILVTHDLSLVASYARHVFVLVNGEIIRQGPSDEVLQPEILTEIYKTDIGVVPLRNNSVFVGLLR